MARRTRYKMDNSGFGDFMMGPEIAAAAYSVAQDVAGEANRTGTNRIQRGYEADFGGPVTVGKRHPSPRQTAIVTNHHRLAAIDEFGSGTKATGVSKGRSRKNRKGQGGGGSPASRHLQKSARKFHDVLGDPE